MDGKSLQNESSFQLDSSTAAVNGLTCSVCGSADFFAENQGELNRSQLSMSIQHSISCYDCLVTAKHARDSKRICDLPPEVLALIFQYSMPSFWFDTLRFVCIQWRTIVDRLCKSFNSIVCYPNGVKFNMEIFDETCANRAVCHIVENSALQLKQFSLLHDIEIYHSMKKCSNLTNLTLFHNLESNLENVKMLCFPNLQNLTLGFFIRFCISENQPFSQHAKIVREVLAHFLSKSNQISGLGFERFTLHFDLFPLIRDLNLKSLNLSGLYTDTRNNLQHGLELATQFVHSLESLEFRFPYVTSLDHAKILPFLLKLSQANKLTTLNWACYVPISHRPTLISVFWSEVTVFGLAGLSNLKQLDLAHLDLTFRPSLQQNRQAAGQLLAPTIQSLTSLQLRNCRFNDIFVEQAFSSHLPNLKKLVMSTAGSVSHSIILRLLGRCPNLEFFTLFLNVSDTGSKWSWSKELFMDVHKVVHAHCCKKQCDGALDLHSLKWLVIVASGMKDLLENFKKWDLCGVRKLHREPDTDHLCISRDGCF